MPKILGANLLGVLLAAIAMYFVGFLWYGVFFTDIWMASRGITEIVAEPDPIWMGLGFLIELVAALGLGWLISRLNISTVGGAIGLAVPLALLIGGPLMSYEFVYNTYHHVGGLLVDISHILATFTLGAVVLSFFD